MNKLSKQLFWPQVCTNGLYGLLKRSGVQGLPARGKAFREAADEFWRRLFNVDKFETASRKFAGEIVTDGKAVGITLRKPKIPEQPRSRPHPDDFSEVWGLDPGRREVFVASNDNGDVKRCSSRHYRDMAGFTRSVKKIQRWQKRDDVVCLIIHAIPRKKTGDSSVLGIHIRYVLFLMTT